MDLQLQQGRVMPAKYCVNFSHSQLNTFSRLVAMYIVILIGITSGCATTGDETIVDLYEATHINTTLGRSGGTATFCHRYAMWLNFSFPGGGTNENC